MPRSVVTCYLQRMLDSGVGAGGAADDEDSESYERRQEVKRVVSRIDPQWADLFDRGADTIVRARRLQRKLAEVLAIAARFLTRR